CDRVPEEHRSDREAGIGERRHRGGKQVADGAERRGDGVPQRDQPRDQSEDQDRDDEDHLDGDDGASVVVPEAAQQARHGELPIRAKTAGMANQTRKLRIPRQMNFRTSRKAAKSPRKVNRITSRSLPRLSFAAQLTAHFFSWRLCGLARVASPERPARRRASFNFGTGTSCSSSMSPTISSSTSSSVMRPCTLPLPSRTTAIGRCDRRNNLKAFATDSAGSRKVAG